MKMREMCIINPVIFQVNESWLFLLSPTRLLHFEPSVFVDMQNESLSRYFWNRLCVTVQCNSRATNPHDPGSDAFLCQRFHEWFMRGYFFNQCFLSATQVTELQTTAKWDHTTSMPTTTANPTQPSNTSMVADHTGKLQYKLWHWDSLITTGYLSWETDLYHTVFSPGKTTALRIGCVSLIIICVLVSIYCYRR